MDLAAMDLASARLAVRLQVEEIDDILKGLSGASGNTVNEIAAFQAHRAELLKKWGEVNGQCAAMAILREENANRTAFTKLLAEERQAETDHEFACRLGGLGPPLKSALKRRNETNAEDLKSEALNGRLDDTKRVRFTVEEHPVASLKRHSDMDVTELKKDSLDGKLDHTKRVRHTAQNCATATKSLGETTSRARVEPNIPENFDGGKGKGKVGLQMHGECSSCLEILPMFNLLQLRCSQDNEQYKHGNSENHAYCRDCLEGLFESSISDSSLFPPRCCSKPIGLFACTPFLSKELLARFVEKKAELDTVNPTYCSNPRCAEWVKPANITADVATCPSCSHMTCATCKTKKHDGLCPEDKDVKQLLRVAEEKQWKACPRCKNMIELNQGCYHITCRCRHEFCYLCLARWKTCTCLTWDQRNIVDDGDGRGAVVPVRGHPAVANPAPVFNAPAPVLHAVAPAPVPVYYHPGPPVPVAPPAMPPQQDRRQPAHQHAFERIYRSRGADTTCDICDNAKRYAEWCSVCEMQVCWYCFKHRT